MDKGIEMLKEQLMDSGWAIYLWVMGVSLWGGLVSFFEKKGEPFSWVRLFAHLLSSSFAGMMTLYLCQYSHVSQPLTGALCGVAAHLGTPALMSTRLFKRILGDLKIEDDKEESK